MSTIHPHWQTDDDEQPVPVTITARKKDSSIPRSPLSDIRSPVKASRRPAAFVGVMLFLIMGAAAFQVYTMSDIRGQVDSNGSITVHLTSNGATPVTITVQPGSTITWQNDDTIPHILTSTSLPTVDGKPFTTSAIFPGSSTHILIPPTAAPGSYPYISQTSTTISGQIIIAAATATATAAPDAATQAAPTQAMDQTNTVNPFTTPAPADTTPPAIPADTQQTSSTDTTPAVTNGIPTNPHTVGSGEFPIPDRPAPGSTAISQHVPTGEPQTGPDVWIVVLLAIGSLLAVTRKAFRSL